MPLTTIDIASEGYLTASGPLPGVGNPNNARFCVRIRLDDEKLRLPAGAQGSATVYTRTINLPASSAWP